MSELALLLLLSLSHLVVEANRVMSDDWTANSGGEMATNEQQQAAQMEEAPQQQLVAEPRERVLRTVSLFPYGHLPFGTRANVADLPIVYWAAGDAPTPDQLGNLKRNPLLSRLASQSARGFGKKRR